MRTLLAALTALMLFAAPVVASDPPVQSAEVVFWQSIANSTDSDDFIAYLERYPHGVFARLARNKLKRMGVVVIAPKAPPKPQPAVAPSKPDNTVNSLDGVYEATSPCGDKFNLNVNGRKIEGWALPSQTDSGPMTMWIYGKMSASRNFSITLTGHGGGGRLSGSLKEAVWESENTYTVGCPNKPFAFTKVE